MILCSSWAPRIYAQPTEVTYYFNGYDPGQAWSQQPGLMVDGDQYTRAHTDWNNPADETQLCNTNTCPGTDLGTITKIEMRARIDVYGIAGYFYITPVFAGSNGATRLFQATYNTWTPWFDITSDPNAPSPWSWTDVQNLDVRVRGVDPAYHDTSCYQIEIRVTYLTREVDTYASDYTNLKDPYSIGETVYAKAINLNTGSLYDFKYFKTGEGSPRWTEANVGENPSNQWRSGTCLLQSGWPTGDWEVRAYDAGTSTLRCSAPFTVQAVPEFPYGAIVALIAGFAIFLVERKTLER